MARYVVIVEATVDNDIEESDVTSVHGPFRSYEAAERFRDRLQVRLDKWMIATQAVNDNDPDHFGSGNALAHASIRHLDGPVVRQAMSSLPVDD